VEEVRDELVLAMLQLILGNAVRARDSNVQAELLAAHQVAVEEVDDAGGVVPSPRAENADLVDGLRGREIVKQRVEVVVAHGAHLAPKSAHFQLSLVVHLANQLLTQFQFHLELNLLLPEEIGALLSKTVKRDKVGLHP
jgi:hypothetical protein